MSIPIRYMSAAIFSVFWMIAVGAGRHPSLEEFRIDTAASEVLVHVDRSGLFAFAGHEHEVAVPAFRGSLTLDRIDVSRSKLSLEFDATAMTVTGKGEPAEDVPEVQRVMLSERVLDVKRHPKISFSSRRISITKQSQDSVGARIEGELTLRGVMKPIVVPLNVQLAGDRITARGTVKVRQTLFGIQPVTAGAGTVRVKDEVEVAFRVVARRAKQTTP